jgi:serine/threonine-protein kinase HipA
MAIELVEVKLWGEQVGAAELSNGRIYFDYFDEFKTKGLEIAPFVAPLNLSVVEGKTGDTFYGLPEFLADALPDKFGNAIIDAYYAQQGISTFSLSALDRLCYVGTRAMGALTFHPAVNTGNENQHEDALVLSRLVDQARRTIAGDLKDEPEDALNEILSVGISAGGARAKAVVALNSDRSEVRSGQVDAPEGFEHWLLKFDGVGKDSALGMSEHYGRVEYAYHCMADAAGINMTDCDLLKENGRAHFMTKRFDRQGNNRVHMQSLCAIASLDFNLAQAHSYEQFFAVTQQLTENYADIEQAIRRAFFNIIARNQDDHTKNLAYLMSDTGQWSLSPAYDVTYAFNPTNQWTREHQMTLAGKTSEFKTGDLTGAVSNFMSEHEANQIIEEVVSAVADWSTYGKQSGLASDEIKKIADNQRLLTSGSSLLFKR